MKNVSRFIILIFAFCTTTLFSNVYMLESKFEGLECSIAYRVNYVETLDLHGISDSQNGFISRDQILEETDLPEMYREHYNVRHAGVFAAEDDIHRVRFPFSGGQRMNDGENSWLGNVPFRIFPDYSYEKCFFDLSLVYNPHHGGEVLYVIISGNSVKKNSCLYNASQFYYYGWESIEKGESILFSYHSHLTIGKRWSTQEEQFPILIDVACQGYGQSAPSE